MFRLACHRQCRDAVAEAERNYEEKLVSSGNLGKFYRHAKSKFTGKTNVGTLLDSNGRPTNDPKTKADILSVHFSKNFTHDDQTNCTVTNISNIHSLQHIVFHPSAVARVIKKLKQNSAGGPDYIPPIFLKKCCRFVAGPLSFLFTVFFRQFFFATCVASSICFANI